MLEAIDRLLRDETGLSPDQFSRCIDLRRLSPVLSSALVQQILNPAPAFVESSYRAFDRTPVVLFDGFPVAKMRCEEATEFKSVVLDPSTTWRNRADLPHTDHALPFLRLCSPAGRAQGTLVFRMDEYAEALDAEIESLEDGAVREFVSGIFESGFLTKVPWQDLSARNPSALYDFFNNYSVVLAQLNLLMSEGHDIFHVLLDLMFDAIDSLYDFEEDPAAISIDWPVPDDTKGRFALVDPFTTFHCQDYCVSSAAQGVGSIFRFPSESEDSAIV